MSEIYSGCIVLFKNDKVTLGKAISSFLNDSDMGILYLIDNSPSDDLKNVFNSKRIMYIHNPSNPGFGSAHNIAIRDSLVKGIKYHFVINPDVHFEQGVIIEMINYMKANIDVGMMMPQILNEDSSIQTLPKLLPSPLDILRRKFKNPRHGYKKFIDKYELRLVPNDLIYNAPVLSGCFTLLNLDVIKDIGMYDDKYFMYFEDWDLSRRVHDRYKTIYFPKVSVYHGYEGGANKSLKLFKVYVSSAIIYFNKWGWFFDDKRNDINKKALSQFK